MVRQTSTFVLLCGLVLAWGCEQKGDTSSAFSDSIEVNGRPLVPIKPPTRKVDKAMIAAAASADEASGKKPAAGPSGTATPDAAAIVIDASTPEGIVKAYVEIMAAGNLAQMPDLLVPDQEKIARPMMDTLGPLIDAFRQMQTAWTEKFPNDPFPLTQNTTPLALGAVKLKAGSINKTSDEEATVDLEAEGDAQGKAITIKLKLIDGNWKIEDPTVPPADKVADVEKFTAAAPKLVEAVQDVTSKIANGELTTSKDAQEAFGKAFLAVLMGQAMQAPGEAEPKPEDAPADSTDTAKPQANNQPDPLDGTYTGPSQLHSR